MRGLFPEKMACECLPIPLGPGQKRLYPSCSIPIPIPKLDSGYFATRPDGLFQGFQLICCCLEAELFRPVPGVKNLWK